VTGTFDDQDRLLAYGGTTYAYTANGGLATRAVSGQNTTYSYDAFGNLRTVQLPSGTLIEYVIDGDNRRIGKTVNGTLVQAWLYEDELRAIAELDAGGNVVARFVYGSRVNVPEYLVRAGATYRIITDSLGSPRLVIDASTGAVAQRLEYDEFGIVLLDTNPGFQPFGFGGGLYDGDTGLVHFGGRDYDPQVGRWTGKDPIGFLAGDSNLFRYVLGDPINNLDVSGFSILVFDRGNGTLSVYPGDGSLAGPPQVFPAGNNAVRPAGDPLTPNSSGPAPNGTFPVGPPVPKDPDPNGKFGGPFFPIRLPEGPNGERSGVGIQSGRASTGGPSHVTRGCIRTTGAAIGALMNDPPTRITIK